MNFLKMVQQIGCNAIRGRGSFQDLNPQGIFTVQHVRQGRILREFSFKNGITITGKNKMLDTFFGKGTPETQVATWYIGMINNSPTPVLAEADTLASHAGWSELTAYTGNRQAWIDADAASKIKGTTTASAFTFNATNSVYGLFIASVASGTSGVLWSTGAFDAVVPVVNLDVLNVTYGVRM